SLSSAFGARSLLLAVAGYDQGEEKLRAVIGKDATDFWSLYRTHKLPPEAMESVARVVAAAIVSEDPGWSDAR
ncbi:MAG TPA: hypothetical protein VH083_01235, partial [Myxococcales bacterium]|nr:hypothetical protein [Myxococcales bacterium]